MLLQRLEWWDGLNVTVELHFMQEGASVNQIFPSWRRKMRVEANAIIFDLGVIREYNGLLLRDSKYIVHPLKPMEMRVDNFNFEYAMYPKYEHAFLLQPGDEETFHVVHSFLVDGDETHRFKAGDPDAAIAASRRRWDAYINRVVANRTVLSFGYDRVVVKAIETLVGNWRSAAGNLTTDAVVPSVTAPLFGGVFAADAWKIAAAVSIFEPNLARDTIDCMLDHQIGWNDSVRPQDAGMVVNSVFYNTDHDRGGKGENWNERNSNPPLAAWAVRRVGEAVQDPQWIESVFSKLQAYHQWWYRNRDHNKNRIPEFGATRHRFHNNDNGELQFIFAMAPEDDRNLNTLFPGLFDRLCTKSQQNRLAYYFCFGVEAYDALRSYNYYVSLYVPVMDAVGWESEMDNAGRFGYITADQLVLYSKLFADGDLGAARADWEVRLLENRDEETGEVVGFSINQESIDLVSHLYQEKLILRDMAEALGHMQAASVYVFEAEALKDVINSCFFDEPIGWFYDFQIYIALNRTRVTSTPPPSMNDAVIKERPHFPLWVWGIVATGMYRLPP